MRPKILVLDRSDELATQVKRIAADLDGQPEVLPCTRLADVGDVLTEDGPFSVLVAGPSLGTRAGLARLQVIHDELPGLAIILSFARRPNTTLREIIRAGALDLLPAGADDDELGAALARALEVSAKAMPTAVATAAVPAEAGVSRNATVFTLASATGGCGKTFLATNLAYFLAAETGKRVCIVDLDLQFGEVSTALRLRPRYTIYDALQRDDADESDLRAHIEEYLVQHETGIWVLAAPKDPTEADRIDPPDVTRIIDALRTRFDYLIVDTPAALTEVVLAAFDLSDLLYTVATLDLPSVRNLGVFLGTLEKLKISSENVRLILNKAERDVGIDVEQVTRLFPQGFRAILPYAREVSRSINLGTPVLASSPASPVSRLLVDGLSELLPEGTQPKHAVAGPEPGGFLKRLFGRPAPAVR